MTSTCIREFSQRFGHFNFALFPEDLTFLILCTTDDYFLVCGTGEIVKDIVGKDVQEAREAFDEYASDPSWPSTVRNNLREIAETYRDTPRLIPVKGPNDSGTTR